MDIKGLIDYMEDVHRPSIALLKMVPKDKLDWKPIGYNCMTLGQMICHLADGPGPGMKGFITGDWGLPPSEAGEEMGLPPAEKMPSCSVEEALEKLEESHQQAKELLTTLSEEHFRNKIVSAPWGMKGPMWRMLLDMVEHQVNHKCQLFMYLKLLGLPVHTGTLYLGE